MIGHVRGCFPYARGDQRPEQAAHLSEIGQSPLDNGELLLGKHARLPAALTILETQQLLDFLQGEPELLRALERRRDLWFVLSETFQRWSIDLEERSTNLTMARYI